MKHIVLGFCHNGMVDMPFYQSMFNFLSWDSGQRQLCLGQIPEQGLYIDDNRNNLTRKFLDKTKAEYFLSVDTDIDFDKEVPYRLFDLAEEKDLPILSAIYVSFIIDGKLRPVWFTDGPDTHGGVRNIGKFNLNELTPLTAAGMGCCLIRRDVFEKMAEVRKDDSWTWFGREGFLLRGTPSHLGEDVSFCLRAKELGFQTWGHSGIEVIHWKKTPLNLDLFILMYEHAKKLGQDY